MSAAAVSAPRPANAIWPSESWPPQPVSTTTEIAQSAKAMIVAQVWWRSDLSLSSGRITAATSAMSGDELRHPFDPPDAAQPFRDRGDARRELEALAARPAVVAADPGDEHQHDDEEHELHEPGLGRVVEEEHPVEDADRDRADHRARERHHAADQRRDHAPQQRVGADVHEVGRRLVGGDEEDRDRAEEPGDRPHAGRHHLRVDAGHAGEVGVRRRGAHRVAERGVAEQPPEPDGDHAARR